MTYKRTYSYDAGGIMSAVLPGDALAYAAPTSIVTVGAGSLTATALVSGVIIRTLSGGAVNDQLDTAVNIMQALYGNTGAGPKVGETFLCMYSNQTGSIMTITTNTGLTLSGTVATAVGTMKAILFVCTSIGTQTYTNGIYTNVGATFNAICM